MDNWPPASIFMGDSGSVFLGYIFGVMIIRTTQTGDINFWTWLIVFAYLNFDSRFVINKSAVRIRAREPLI